MKLLTLLLALLLAVPLFSQSAKADVAFLTADHAEILANGTLKIVYRTALARLTGSTGVSNFTWDSFLNPPASNEITLATYAVNASGMVRFFPALTGFQLESNTDTSGCGSSTNQGCFLTQTWYFSDVGWRGFGACITININLRNYVDCHYSSIYGLKTTSPSYYGGMLDPTTQAESVTHANQTWESQTHTNQTWESQTHANQTWESQTHANASGNYSGNFTGNFEGNFTMNNTDNLTLQGGSFAVTTAADAWLPIVVWLLILFVCLWYGAWLPVVGAMIGLGNSIFPAPFWPLGVDVLLLAILLVLHTLIMRGIIPSVWGAKQ